MDLLRYSTDAWGQKTIEGISWDMLWVFLGLALAFILFHLIFHDLVKKQQKTKF